MAAETLARLESSSLLRPGARVVAEHEVDAAPVGSGPLVAADTRCYGDTALSFFHVPTDTPDPTEAS